MGADTLSSWVSLSCLVIPMGKHGATFARGTGNRFRLLASRFPLTKKRQGLGPTIPLGGSGDRDSDARKLDCLFGCLPLFPSLPLEKAMTEALTLPGVEVGVWQVRSKGDPMAMALFDRHYSRQKIGRGEVGPPGRKLVLVTPCERAMWCTHWPKPELTMDGLDAWRCSVFRNEGAGLASFLIREAMAVTEQMWGSPPPDGWVTWVDTRKVESSNPGYCFKQAGWWLDREWTHKHLVRLRA